MKFRIPFLVVFFFTSLTQFCLAHETQRSYLLIDSSAADSSFEFKFDIIDLSLIFDLDMNDNNVIEFGEISENIEGFTSYIQGVVLIKGARTCKFSSPAAKISKGNNRTELLLKFHDNCIDHNLPIEIKSHLFSTVSPDHRTFVALNLNGSSLTTVIDGSGLPVNMAVDRPKISVVIWDYIKLGMTHLIEGLDHIVFVILLVTPIIRSRESFGGQVLAMLPPITGFTVGHAITLTASLTNTLSPSVPLIEIFIAASIVLTAVLNLSGVTVRHASGLAAFFGTIHGFGFAAALGSIDVSGWTLAVALIGFNVGLEIAQVGLILIFTLTFGKLMQMRLIYQALTCTFAALGMFWLFQRLSELTQ